MAKNLIWGPTFDEMLNPELVDTTIRQNAKKAFTEDPLHPINLYNINWYDNDGNLSYYVIPKSITGVKANIVFMVGKNFPTGSHKVGATYSVTMEKQLNNEIVPGEDTIIFPSTGNYGIGGSWTGPRMGYETKVILPELMSQERFDKIKYYGAEYIKTKGCESSVKEIYDKCWELKKQSPKNKVLNQFESFGNYMFHYYVSGNSMNKVLEELKNKGIGQGYASALVSAMGSSGSIAAGDRLKQLYDNCKIIGLEPIKCPTLYNNGYGDHDIQGIGDKHVTWIHNVMNMDAIMCIDDVECKKVLQLFSDPAGKNFLINKIGINQIDVEKLSTYFGISGICNLFGAIKTAKYYDMDENDVIFTFATDSIDRYYSIMEQLNSEYGKLDTVESNIRYYGILNNLKDDYIEEGTYKNRKRWHNLKYYTWVEQQGKTVEELNAQMQQKYWIEKQNLIPSIDENLRSIRK